MKKNDNKKVAIKKGPFINESQRDRNQYSEFNNSDKPFLQMKREYDYGQRAMKV